MPAKKKNSPGAGTLVYGDSVGVMIEKAGGLQGFAVGGKPSGWILDSIYKAATATSNHDVILSTGASNDALNIVASWLKNNGREGIVIGDRDIQQIKGSDAYQRFRDNVARQIETLMNNEARHVYVAGVETGPEDVPNYLERKTVGYARGGIFSALGVNTDIAAIVEDYKKHHPEMAGRVLFGGPAQHALSDRIHPNETGCRKIATDAQEFFQGTSGLYQENDNRSVLAIGATQRARDTSGPAYNSTADADEGRLRAAADQGEALFRSNSTSLTTEQTEHLKAFFTHKLVEARQQGSLGQLKIDFAASADAVGSDAVNTKLARERLKVEQAVFNRAEVESGVTISDRNITSHVLGRQGGAHMRDQSKRRATATFRALPNLVRT